MYTSDSIYSRETTGVNIAAIKEAIAEYQLTVDSLQSQLASLDLGLGYAEHSQPVRLSRRERAWIRKARAHYRKHRKLSPEAMAQVAHLQATRDWTRYLTSTERKAVAGQSKRWKAGIAPLRPSIGQLFAEARDAGTDADIPVADYREALSFNDIMGTTGEHDADNHERGIEELMFD